jgi:hypothetical protein
MSLSAGRAEFSKEEVAWSFCGQLEQERDYKVVVESQKLPKMKGQRTQKIALGIQMAIRHETRWLGKGQDPSSAIC